MKINCYELDDDEKKETAAYAELERVLYAKSKEEREELAKLTVELKKMAKFTVELKKMAKELGEKGLYTLVEQDSRRLQAAHLYEDSMNAKEKSPGKKAMEEEFAPDTTTTYSSEEETISLGEMDSLVFKEPLGVPRIYLDGWKSITDEMPEWTRRIIGFFPNYSNSTIICSLVKQDSQGYHFESESTIANRDIRTELTHWMPLPPDPKPDTINKEERNGYARVKI